MQNLANATTTTEATARDMENLQQAQDKLESEASMDLIDVSALPYYGNASVEVWMPPLESYLLGEDDLTTVFGAVLHEILSNMTFYGADVLLEDILQIYQLDQVITPLGVQNLIDVGLPSRSEMMVASRETGIFDDVLTEVTSLLSEQANLTDWAEKPFEGIISIANAMIEDPDNAVWLDLTIILGDTLGPALVPVLRSDFAKNATRDPEGVAQRAQEIFPKLLDDFRTFGMKNLLYNPYLPATCLDDEVACPADIMGRKEVEELRQAKQGVLNGSVSEESFEREFMEAMYRYVQVDLGYGDLEAFVFQLMQEIFNEKTSVVVKAFSEETEPSAKEVEVLNSLAAGNYSMETDEEVLDAGFDAKRFICLANVSAAMFEFPETADAWINQGHGFETVGIFPLAGDLSNRAGIFVDKAQRAVVVGVEGTPYIHTYFVRGLFGWLKNIVQADPKPFNYCNDTALCDDMAAAFPSAEIYPGFAPFDSFIVSDLKPALDQAVERLSADNETDFRINSAAEKPKLYITGHSLGGATAKDTYAQVLLRGYGDAFSSVELYASAGPVSGNVEYLEMVEEVSRRTNASMYQISNAYDPVPYLPVITDIDKKPTTAMYDTTQDRLVKAEPLQPYEKAPSNILLSPFGFHAIKSQYLPLARSLTDYDVKGNCEWICNIEQCGLFKCPDSCQGVL